MKFKARNFAPAFAWFIVSLVLFTLPPPKFPEQGLFDIPHKDKIVHFIIFFILVYLFSRPVKTTILSIKGKKSWLISIALYGLAYGIIIEFVQKYFVPNRSYEVWDIFADGLGCLAAYVYARKYFV